MKKFILLLITLFPSFVFSQVPHTFQSGDPVSSSKINENFAFASKRLYLKNNGTIIGTILSVSYNCNGNCGDYNYDIFVTDKGFFFFGLYNMFFQPSLVTESGVYYQSSDCTGNAYAINARSVNTVHRSGRKFYYSNASDSPATYGNMYSTYDGSTCRNQGMYSSDPKYLLKENDESITGFPGSIGTLTISYE